MKTGISKRFLFIGAIVMILAMLLAYPFGIGVADALTLDGKEMSSFWYYGESGLKIDSAKPVIDTWNKSKLTQKIIAVIDTGLDYEHELFDGVLYENEKGEQVGYDARLKKEVDVKDIPDNAKESDGRMDKHGNAMAGVIAMMIKELGLQDYVKIYPIKANSNSPSEAPKFTVANVVESLNQAKKIGASAVNLSLGIVKKNNTDQKWVNDKSLIYALEDVSNSAIIVAAAGNDGLDSDLSDDNLFYPAVHDGVLSVMAYGKSGLYKDSNFGSVYDIAGPGEDIFTAKYPGSATSANPNGSSLSTYDSKNGTSLATPMVTFAGVLLELRYEAEGKSMPTSVDVARMLRNLDGRTIDKADNVIRCLDYHTVVTQDFENTNYVYDDPTGIGVSHNGTYGTEAYDETIYMRANDIKAVTFIAKINPSGKTDPALESAVQWIERRPNMSETVVGYGLRLDYTPKYIDETVSIIARLRFGDTKFEQMEDVRVASVPFMVGDARVTYAKNATDNVNSAPSSGVIYTDETVEFSLTGIQFVDANKKKEIKWYVDGEYAGKGEFFRYEPKKAGTHKISARYDDSPIPREFTATVKPFIARPLDLSMLIVGLVIAIAVITIVITIVVKKKTENKKRDI